MLGWLVVSLFGVLYAYLFTFINDSIYFLPLYLVCGFLISLILMALYILLFIFFMPYSKPDNKLKHKMILPILKFVHTVIRVKIYVVGEENIPSSTYVIYGNHKSMLDVTVVYQAYHTVLSAVAKSTLKNVPILSRMLKGLGVTMLDRNNNRQGAKDMLEAIKNVKSGRNYLIFPEGGIKSRETEHMVALRAGAYKLATKPRAVISPISIIGNSKLSENCPKRKTKITVVIHRPVLPEEYEGLTTEEIGRKVAAIVNKGIDTLVPNTLEFSKIEGIILGDENE